jgi:hypothetical protein
MAAAIAAKSILRTTPRRLIKLHATEDRVDHPKARLRLCCAGYCTNTALDDHPKMPGLSLCAMHLGEFDEQSTLTAEQQDGTCTLCSGNVMGIKRGPQNVKPIHEQEDIPTIPDLLKLRGTAVYAHASANISILHECDRFATCKTNLCAPCLHKTFKYGPLVVLSASANFLCPPCTNEKLQRAAATQIEAAR